MFKSIKKGLKKIGKGIKKVLSGIFNELKSFSRYIGFLLLIVTGTGILGSPFFIPAILLLTGVITPIVGLPLMGGGILISMYILLRLP